MMSQWMKDLPVLKERVDKEKEIKFLRVFLCARDISSCQAWITNSMGRWRSIVQWVLQFKEHVWISCHHIDIWQILERGIWCLCAGHLTLDEEAQAYNLSRNSQEDPQVTMSDALDFVLKIACPAFCLTLPYCDSWFILNMNYTPLLFSMHSSTTTDTVGNKSVNIHTAKKVCSMPLLLCVSLQQGINCHPW